MLARRDTRMKASRLRRLSPLQTLEDQSQAWAICCHFCTGREGLAPSWKTELQSFRLCGLPEDRVLFRPTGHTGRSVSVTDEQKAGRDLNGRLLAGWLYGPHREPAPHHTNFVTHRRLSPEAGLAQRVNQSNPG